MEPTQHLLVFGASGAIGSAVVRSALLRGWQVTAVARQLPKQSLEGVRALVVDPLNGSFDADQLRSTGPYSSGRYDSVCWAQGCNGSDSVYDFDVGRHRDIYDANCTYILMTLQALLVGRLLAAGSRLCVISSIWQNLARNSKLSYCMSKAALQGLVLSAAADMAKDGHLINAVLPGALDTPMTRASLNPDQMQQLTSATGHQRLVTVEDVAKLACFLCSAEIGGITGQFIAADLGYSHVRIV